MKYARTSAAGLLVIGAVAAIVLSGVGRTDSSGIALVRAIVGVGLLVLFASTANGLSQTGAPLRDIEDGDYQVRYCRPAACYQSVPTEVFIICRKNEVPGDKGRNDYFFYVLPLAAFEGGVPGEPREGILRVEKSGPFKKLRFFEERPRQVVSHGTQR